MVDRSICRQVTSSCKVKLLTLHKHLRSEFKKKIQNPSTYILQKSWHITCIEVWEYILLLASSSSFTWATFLINFAWCHVICIVVLSSLVHILYDWSTGPISTKIEQKQTEHSLINDIKIVKWKVCPLQGGGGVLMRK